MLIQQRWIYTEKLISGLLVFPNTSYKKQIDYKRKYSS